MNASRILAIVRSPSRPWFARCRGFSFSCVSAAAVIAVVACVCLPGSSAAQCIDYGDYLHWAGVLYAATDAVVVSGSYAYIADFSRNFRVVDITDPTTPQIVGSVITADNARDIAVADQPASPLVQVANYAYIVGFMGLQVINLENPANPQIVGSLDIPGTLDAVAVSGNYAYVGGDWLQVVDIANPESPQHIGDVFLGGSISNIAISGDYAYLTNTLGALHVLDITNPESPHHVGSVLTPEGPSMAVAVSGTHAYVGGGEFGPGQGYLCAVDVSNPQSPQIVGSELLPGRASGVAVLSTQVYAAVLTNQNSPSANGVLCVIDCVNPQDPLMVGQLGAFDPVVDMAASNTHLYLANELAGLRVAEIGSANPGTPPIEGSMSLSAAPQDVAVSGNYAFVGLTSALRVVNIANPVFPHSVGSLPVLPAMVSSIALSGTHVYIADGNLTVVDATNLQTPQVVGSVVTPGISLDVAASNTHAYVADGISGLQVIDISNPPSPQIVGSVDTPGSAESVAISGAHAYVADGVFGLQAIDISNPENPQIVGNVVWQGTANDVVVSESHAYVLQDSGQLFYVIDIANPGSPQIAGSMRLPDVARNLAVSGSYVYVAVTQVGLAVIDVTDPASPRVEGGVMIGGSATSVAVSGSYAYVAASGSPLPTSRFSVVPAQCPQTAGVEPVEAPGVAGAGSLPFTLAQNQPNPFVAGRGATAIAFDLRDGAHAKLRVFDLNGRVVRVLVDAAIGAGPHTVSWDGRTETGKEAASGTYYYRLEVGERSESRALVKLR